MEFDFNSKEMSLENKIKEAAKNLLNKLETKINKQKF